MSSRWWSVGVAACLAGSAVFWGLRLAVQPAPVPAGAQVAQAGVAARGDLSRLLGQDAPAPAAAQEPPADARFQLLGVVAPGRGGEGGIALIAVDGKPARAVRVGQTVDGPNVLKRVSARQVQLGPADGPATINLTPPTLPAAATGALPSVAGGPGATASPSTVVGAAAPPDFVAPGVFNPSIRAGMARATGGAVVQGGTQVVMQPARSPDEPGAPAVQRPRPMVPPQLVAPQQPPATLPPQ